MGYTQKLPNGKFRARWRDPDGLLKSRTFEKERDAERHLRSQEVALDRGLYADDSLGKVTFAEWAEHCFALDPGPQDLRPRHAPTEPPRPSEVGADSACPDQ